MVNNTEFAEFVGISPAGIEWVAYKPELVDRLRARLAEVWRRFNAKERAAFQAVRVHQYQVDGQWVECRVIKQWQRQVELLVPGLGRMTVRKSSRFYRFAARGAK